MMESIRTKGLKLKTKRIFLKKGTCSRTFYFILNREFGNPMDLEENAIDPLAGGIHQQGYQCGMLWGSAMALGAEAYRRFDGDVDKATGISIRGTAHLMKSFKEKANTISCDEITSCDFSNKWSFLKYMLSGKFYGCFRLAGKWAPNAIKAAREGLELSSAELPDAPLSCASEVVRQMGGSEKDQVMVSGFAGGLGLSGDGCGALSAAIWMITRDEIQTNDWTYGRNDKFIDGIVDRFFEQSGYEMECQKICGRRFETIEAHSEFIRRGGCENIIERLASLRRKN